MAHAHDRQDDHDHDHVGHDHNEHDHGGHGHVHAPASFGKAFAIGIALNAGFVVLEVVCGLLSNSVALLADAGHNMSDVLGLGVAWAAAVLTRRAPTQRPRWHIDPSRFIQCGVRSRNSCRALRHRYFASCVSSRRAALVSVSGPPRQCSIWSCISSRLALLTRCRRLGAAARDRRTGGLLRTSSGLPPDDRAVFSPILLERIRAMVGGPGSTPQSPALSEQHRKCGRGDGVAWRKAARRPDGSGGVAGVSRCREPQAGDARPTLGRRSATGCDRSRFGESAAHHFGR